MEGGNELAPEARKKLAPAEGRGFRLTVSQPRKGRKIVRIHLSALRASRPLVCQVPGLAAGATLLRPSGPVHSWPLYLRVWAPLTFLRNESPHTPEVLRYTAGTSCNWNTLPSGSIPSQRLMPWNSHSFSAPFSSPPSSF